MTINPTRKQLLPMPLALVAALNPGGTFTQFAYFIKPNKEIPC